MLVCIDTNIWIDIFKSKSRKTNPKQDKLLELGNERVNHPLVRLELLLGTNVTPEQKKEVSISLVADIYIPTASEVEAFVVKHQVAGSGLNIVDVQIIMGCLVNKYALWTRDGPIIETAAKTGIIIFKE